MKALTPTTKYMLEALIPYSKANLRLVYKPSSFFSELEKKRHIKERTSRSAYYRAIKNGLLELDQAGVPRLTQKGRQKVKLYKPKKLASDSCLMVIFDISESERAKRDRLRILLRELSFKKVQQSVWVSRYDHREYLAAEIKEYGLENNVLVYEAVKLHV